MIRKIAVLGAGTMGHGIAETFALNGFKVNLYEPFDMIRENVIDVIKGELEFLSEHGAIEKDSLDIAIDNITLFKELQEAVYDADYIIEATPEKLDLKQDLFKKLHEYCKKSAILASNTSSLPLKEMFALVPKERYAKAMVCHWYNPPHLMPIAELSYFGNMSEEDYKEVEALYERAGKQTVKVLKDVPGLVANRIQQGVAREVFSLIENGIASPEDVDKALKFGPAFRYATTGQLEVADMGGLDIWCTVGDNLLSEMDNSTCANPILRQKVSEGKLGIKTGEGFFKYSKEEADNVKTEFQKRLIIQLNTSKNYIIKK